MKGYPLGVAGFVAMACDCIRRGDLVGAEASLARANRLIAEGEARRSGRKAPPRPPQRAPRRGIDPVH